MNRAVKNAMLVGDMPFEAYRSILKRRLKMPEVCRGSWRGAVAEWFDACLNVAEEIIRADPLMGYVGLTSQTADKLWI